MHNGKLEITGYAYKDSGHWCLVLEAPKWILEDMVRDLRVTNHIFHANGPSLQCDYDPNFQQSSIMLQFREMPEWMKEGYQKQREEWEASKQLEENNGTS